MKNLKLTIILLLVLAAGLSGLVGRCFYLQFFKVDHYLKEAVRPQEATVIEKPSRGIILDSCGRVLAASNRVQSVFAEPRVIEDVDATAKKLSPLLEVSAETLAATIKASKNPGFVKLVTGVLPKQRDAVIAAQIRGIGIMNDYLRHYPNGSMASHVVGFVNSERSGLGGIELEYDKIAAAAKMAQIFSTPMLRGG